MTMLIDVILKGIVPVIDFSFLKELLAEARETYFNSPEIDSEITFKNVTNIINGNTYTDLVINTDLLRMNEKIVPKVFINLGRNNEKIELLLFFDLKDLNEPTEKSNIEYLRNWTAEFQKQYGFDYFICQMDNANEDEYYFDSYGWGPLL